jgi:hypothetical protein
MRGFPFQRGRSSGLSSSGVPSRPLGFDLAAGVTSKSTASHFHLPHRIQLHLHPHVRLHIQPRLVHVQLRLDIDGNFFFSVIFMVVFMLCNFIIFSFSFSFVFMFMFYFLFLSVPLPLRQHSTCQVRTRSPIAESNPLPLRRQ